MLSGRDAHNIGHFFQQILELFAGGHDRVFCLALIALRNAPETHILNCFKSFESLVPVAVDLFSKLGVHIYIAAHRRAIGVRDNRIGLHGGHHIAARGHAVVEHIADIFFYYTAPAALVDIGLRILLDKRIEPQIGERISGRDIIHFDYQLREILVAAAGGHHVAEPRKAAVRILFVCPLEHCRADIVFHYDRRLVVEQRIIRRYAERVEILAHKVVAEAVDSAYLRKRQEHILAAKMPVRRILREAFEYRRAYLLAHLRGGGTGEGDYQQILCRAGVIFVRQAADNALDEHRRLARTCRSADKYRAFTALYRVLLISRPVDSHSSSPSPSFRLSFNSLAGILLSCVQMFQYSHFEQISL